MCWFFSNFLRSKTLKPTNLCILPRVFNLQIFRQSELLQNYPQKLTEENKCVISIFKSCYKGACISTDYIRAPKSEKAKNFCNHLQVAVSLSLYPMALAFKGILIASLSTQQAGLGYHKRLEELSTKGIYWFAEQFSKFSK